jgi:predicted ribosomally synthesized peptide with SipW-like signal peptide
MKKILLSMAVLAVAAGLAVWGSRAFFSDTETSTGNLFQAGAIDLKVDNDSWYNGQRSENTSWDLRDLTVERFFNFTDLKPGDWGEDTISLHVNSNDAYVCANVQITDNSDNGITEPEDEVDAVIDNSDGTPNGDLAQELNFMFWLDDGDNVWEVNEPVLTQGPASNVLDGATYALALNNGGAFDGPFPANTTEYIGKAWCYGEMDYTQAPQQDWPSPADYDGFHCNGAPVNNISQTDRLMGDINFYAVQARNNDEFTCDSVQWNTPEVSYQDLENKTDNTWQVIEDDTYGTIAYSTNAGNFYGVVQGYGLEPDSKYQITLNGPGDSCGFTDTALGNFGSNSFQSGFWDGIGPNLQSSCSDSWEGLYSMNLIGSYDGEYTVMTNASGDFIYPFNLALPAGTYSNVKVLVKKTLNPYVSPWTDSTTVHTTNLFETAALNFTVL